MAIYHCNWSYFFPKGPLMMLRSPPISIGKVSLAQSWTNSERKGSLKSCWAGPYIETSNHLKLFLILNFMKYSPFYISPISKGCRFMPSNMPPEHPLRGLQGHRKISPPPRFLREVFEHSFLQVFDKAIKSRPFQELN